MNCPYSALINCLLETQPKLFLVKFVPSNWTQPFKQVPEQPEFFKRPYSLNAPTALMKLPLQP